MRFKRKDNPEHVIDILFSLALFVLFALIGICVVLIGSRIYQSTASHMEANYTSRTALAYVSEKIRQSDSSEAIEIIKPKGFTDQALILHQTIGRTDYDTYIYFYDGALRELLVKKGTPITPEQGTALVSLSSFEIEKTEDELFIFTAAEDGGKKSSIMIHPDSRQ